MFYFDSVFYDVEWQNLNIFHDLWTIMKIWIFRGKYENWKILGGKYVLFLFCCFNGAPKHLLLLMFLSKLNDLISHSLCVYLIFWWKFWNPISEKLWVCIGNKNMQKTNFSARAEGEIKSCWPWCWHWNDFVSTWKVSLSSMLRWSHYTRNETSHYLVMTLM